MAKKQRKSGSLAQYYKRRNRKNGLFLAVRKKGENKVVITASKAKVTAGDSFDAEEAMRIAQERQETVREGRPNTVPQSMVGQISSFLKRCERYFKGVKVEVPAVQDVAVRTLQNKK
jgi:hypothetical protein